MYATSDAKILTTRCKQCSQNYGLWPTSYRFLDAIHRQNTKTKMQACYDGNLRSWSMQHAIFGNVGLGRS